MFVTPAAVRLPRTVAVRRALLAGLFLIGFVLLGVAYGSGAHAADRTPVDGSPAAAALSGAPAPDHVTASRRTGRPGLPNSADAGVVTRFHRVHACPDPLPEGGFSSPHSATASEC